MPKEQKKKRRRLRYEHWRSVTNQQWYAHLRSGNEVLMVTEGYDHENDSLKPGRAVGSFFAMDVDLVFKRIPDPNAPKADPAQIPLPITG